MSLRDDIALPPPQLRLEHAPCGLLVTHPDGSIISANTTFCVWLGYALDELVGIKCFADLLPVGARVFHQTHWVPLLQLQGSVSEIQFDLLHRDGRRIPMMLNVVRHAAGATCAARDEIAAFVAKDRKEYERELRAARHKAEAALRELELAEARMRDLNDELSRQHTRKDEFLATLAHELRNPLAPIVNVLQTLSLKKYDDPHLTWAQQVLDRQARQLTHLVDDLLEISRITQNKLELRRVWIDLAASAASAGENCLPMYEAAAQQLSVVLPADAVWIHADPTRVAQIITNLLHNASKYTPEGGAAKLTVRVDGAQAVVTVSDNGVGIPADQLRTVFTMFSQLNPALERAEGGLGIGLALVQGLVMLHGGTVEARSAGVGEGSEFEVRLPMLAESQAPEPGQEPAVEQGQGLEARQDAAPPPPLVAHRAGIKIVVVDDNVDAAESLEMALDMLGYEVRIAHDGLSGLALIGQFRPEFVLLDIGLPDLSGYDVARRIRHTMPDADIVLIAATGWGQAADKQAALDAGFDAHFTKPIDFHKLDRAIADLRRVR